MWISIALAFATAATGSYFALTDAPTGAPELVITVRDADLGTVELGTHLVTFEITNPSTRDRAIVGVDEG